MKELKNHTFRDGVTVYSGLQDYFGNSMLVLVDDDMNELRTVGKLKDYKKRRRMLDEKNLRHVSTPEYGEVIDITKRTYDKIMENFPGYSHTRWQILD